VRVWNRAQVMRSNATPLFERVAKVFGGLAMSHSDEPAQPAHNENVTLV